MPWLWFFVPVALWLVVWVVLELRTARPDGTLLRVHPVRRILIALMPERNASIVYFDAAVDATRLQAFLDAKASAGIHVTHATVAAAGMALSATPKMNRFVAGGRLYARNRRWLTFSLKRKRLDTEAAISTVKLEFRDGEDLAAFAQRVNASVGEERSGKKTRTDKELDLFNLLPRPALRLGVRLFRWLDDKNLLPGWFIDGDPLYTSIFLANLGSLGMGPGYHHLFEYGTCPLFIMIGKVEQRAVVVDGEVVVRPILPVRFTYDERIEDGLNARFGIDRFVRVLEDPDRFLEGALWPRADLG